jgi:hypothetical protein
MIRWDWIIIPWAFGVCVFLITLNWWVGAIVIMFVSTVVRFVVEDRYSNRRG